MIDFITHSLEQARREIADLRRLDIPRTDGQT